MTICKRCGGEGRRYNRIAEAEVECLGCEGKGVLPDLWPTAPARRPRNSVPDGEEARTHTVRLTDAEWKEFRRRGGTKWLRTLLAECPVDPLKAGANPADLVAAAITGKCRVKGRCAVWACFREDWGNGRFVQGSYKLIVAQDGSDLAMEVAHAKLKIRANDITLTDVTFIGLESQARKQP